MTNLLGPKALAHAVQALDFIPDSECFLLGNDIDAYDVYCDLDDFNAVDYPTDHINNLTLPRGVQVVGLQHGDDQIVGIVNFGTIKRNL